MNIALISTPDRQNCLKVLIEVSMPDGSQILYYPSLDKLIGAVKDPDPDLLIIDIEDTRDDFWYLKNLREIFPSCKIILIGTKHQLKILTSRYPNSYDSFLEKSEMTSQLGSTLSRIIQRD